MAYFIDKSALVAEINKRIIDAPINNIGHQRVWAYNDVKDILDTLEVKEVDLEKEVDDVMKRFLGNITCREEQLKFAKHFFELGVNASNPLTWEDMNELYIIFADVDTDIELCMTDIKPETIGYYEEVLKRFKAQKGEKVC